ncbi:MAG: MFS transporter, partial [Dehalococcoidia bacterium]
MTAAIPQTGTAWTRTFHALGNRNFRIFWLGMLIAALGMRLYALALTWLVLSRTNSALALGILTTIEGLPILLFALFGGVLAERLRRRRLLTVLRTAMLAEALVFAVVVSRGVGEIWVIYAFASLGGLFAAVDIPTTQAFLEDLVGTEQAELANASALTITLQNVSKVVGALAGGVIIAAVGEAACLYITAAGILGLLIALLLIDEGLLHPAAPQPSGGMLGKAREGLTYAARTPDVATIVLLLAALGLFGYNLSVLLPLIVRYVLDSGPFGLGVLTAALGVGSLAGSLLVDFTGRGRRHTVLI